MIITTTKFNSRSHCSIISRGPLKYSIGLLLMNHYAMCVIPLQQKKTVLFVCLFFWQAGHHE